jgi:hypothetical protein
MTQYSDIRKYNTKEKQHLYVQLCNTAHCKKSIIIMERKIHNDLPLKIKKENKQKSLRFLKTN